MLSVIVTRIVWLELVKCGTAAGRPMAGLPPTTVSIEADKNVTHF